jgi:hypothetical protein
MWNLLTSAATVVLMRPAWDDQSGGGRTIDWLSNRPVPNPAFPPKAVLSLTELIINHETHQAHEKKILINHHQAILTIMRSQTGFSPSFRVVRVFRG